MTRSMQRNCVLSLLTRMKTLNQVFCRMANLAVLQLCFLVWFVWEMLWGCNVCMCIYVLYVCVRVCDLYFSTFTKTFQPVLLFVSWDKKQAKGLNVI